MWLWIRLITLMVDVQKLIHLSLLLEERLLNWINKYMARSRWKLSFFSKSIWRKIVLLKKKDILKKKKYLYDRSSTIPECFSGFFLRIHKGKRFRRLMIHMYNVGSKFGEFSFTRKPYHFPLKKSLKRKNQFFKK